MLKIAITGPESSGKTTLARQLATFLGAPCVPEYARIYLNLLQRPYRAEDLHRIAQGQKAWEDVLACLQPAFLVCDTDALVLKIWAEYKYGVCPAYIQQWWEARPYHLHLLCKPDIPWQYDPLREHPHQREALYSLYLETLQQERAPYAIVQGAEMERLEAAVRSIRELL